MSSVGKEKEKLTTKSKIKVTCLSMTITIECNSLNQNSFIKAFITKEPF